MSDRLEALLTDTLTTLRRGGDASDAWLAKHLAAAVRSEFIERNQLQQVGTVKVCGHNRCVKHLEPVFRLVGDTEETP